MTIRISTYGRRDEKLILRRVTADMGQPYLELELGRFAGLIHRDQIPELIKTIKELMK